MKAKRLKTSVLAALQAVSVVTLLCASIGCASVRWTGDTATHSLNKDIKLKSKYRIERICFICPPVSRAGNSTMVASLMDKIGKSNFKSILPQKRPDIFSESKDAIPIVVNMNLSDENSRWELGLYILTLGLLPGETHEDCLFQLDVQRMSDMKRTKGTFVTIKYDFKMSLFTPLGLISFDHDDSVAISRETLTTSQDVQPETIAAAVVAQLQQLELEDLAKSSHAMQIGEQKTHNVTLQQRIDSLRSLRDAGTITEQEYQNMVLRAINQTK